MASSSLEEGSDRIRLGEWVVVERSNGTKALVRVLERNEIKVGKRRMLTGQLAGHVYGRALVLRDALPGDVPSAVEQQIAKTNETRKNRNKQELKYSRVELADPQDEDSDAEEEESDEEEEAEEDLEEGMKRDNRNLTDSVRHQTLSDEAILEMKRSGALDEQVVSALIQNSSTYESKTVISQAKYVAKLTKKHVSKIRVTRVNARSIAEVIHEKNPASVNEDRLRGLRWFDALPLMLAYGNVHAGSTPLVLDGTGGLLTTAVLERLVDGKVHCVATTRTEAQGELKLGITSFLNLSQKERDDKLCIVSTEDLAKRASSPPASEPLAPSKRVKLDPEAAPQTEEEKAPFYSSLMVASRHDPSQVLDALLPHLGSGMPFVFHSPTIEPLMRARKRLETHHFAAQVAVIETWGREYQVLPMRTHPLNSGSATSGFILKGIKVMPHHVKPLPS